MREWDRKEFEASASLRSITDAALACHYASQGFAWVALLDGEPQGAIGVARSPLQPHLGAAWAFGANRFKRTVPELSRLARMFQEWLIEDGVRRVEARCLKGHDLAGRWMSALGAKHECDLECYGVNGETFELWAWTHKEQ
jgi:hypothetical protein